MSPLDGVRAPASGLRQSAPRIEDPALLRGEGRYLADLVLPDMLHAAFLRSSHAHARIARLDLEAARNLPGVVAVYDSAGLLPALTGPRMPLGFPSSTLQRDITPWVLSDREVAFVGEAIAMVVARSRAIAEDALALIEVDYEALPVVHDLRQAIEPDAPPVRTEAESNVAERFRVGFGDVAAAFADAPTASPRPCGCTAAPHTRWRAGACSPASTRSGARSPSGHRPRWRTRRCTPSPRCSGSTSTTCA